MQVREFSASLGADSPPLLGAVIKDGTESGKGESFNAMAVTAHHRRRHG